MFFTLKILSQPSNEVSLWATIIMVFVPLSFKIDLIILASVWLSNADVASSKIKTSGVSFRALASPILCFDHQIFYLLVLQHLFPILQATYLKRIKFCVLSAFIIFIWSSFFVFLPKEMLFRIESSSKLIEEHNLFYFSIFIDLID